VACYPKPRSNEGWRTIGDEGQNWQLTAVRGAAPIFDPKDGEQISWINNLGTGSHFKHDTRRLKRC